jgi:aryl-alcohol dehydrogenase-like predicted oxidoreductase
MTPPIGNSPQFSLAVPLCEVWPTTQSVSGSEHVKQIEWYEENDIELLCWEVLDKGFMAKPDLWPQHEVDPDTFYTPVEEGSDDWRVQRIQRAYCNTENYRRRDLAIQLSKTCGCKLSQVAVMYPLSMGKHMIVIFGST